MGDLEWVNTADIFDGHRFFEFKTVDGEFAASIVRAVVQHDDFVAPLVESVLTARKELVEILKEYPALSKESVSAEYRFHLGMTAATWSDRRKFAKLVEGVVYDGVWALDTFRDLPKRSPAEHAAKYKRIASLSLDLMSEINGDTIFGEANGELRELLDILHRDAQSRIDDVPLARPNARNADRTFVAKAVSQSFMLHTSGYRHAAAATLVNAIFPGREPIDAVYMQSLARTIKDPLLIDLPVKP